MKINYMDQIDYKNKVRNEIIIWAPYAYHSYNVAMLFTFFGFNHLCLLLSW